MADNGVQIRYCFPGKACRTVMRGERYPSVDKELVAGDSLKAEQAGIHQRKSQGPCLEPCAPGIQVIGVVDADVDLHKPFSNLYAILQIFSLCIF